MTSQDLLPLVKLYLDSMARVRSMKDSRSSGTSNAAGTAADGATAQPDIPDSTPFMLAYLDFLPQEVVKAPGVGQVYTLEFLHGLRWHMFEHMLRQVRVLLWHFLPRAAAFFGCLCSLLQRSSWRLYCRTAARVVGPSHRETHVVVSTSGRVLVVWWVDDLCGADCPRLQRRGGTRAALPCRRRAYMGLSK